jgi:tetratricopeptide (TPR) repeat protein
MAAGFRDKIGRMLRTTAVLSLTLFLLLPVSQAASQSKGHILYGDLKVDEKKMAGIPNLAYTITLYTVAGSGMAFGRTTIPAGGRYRFFNVPNGEYELAIETGGREVARINILLQEKAFTDIRRDIELAYSPDPVGQPGARPAASLSLEAHPRSQENALDFEKAQKAVAANEYVEAVALLRKIVAADPKDFQAWTELGTALFKQKSLPEAAKAFSQALQLKPSYELALLNLGKLQLAQKNNEAAVETLTTLVEAQPRIAEAQFCLGEALLQVKKGSMAVVHLNEALRLDPTGMADAHLRLAALYNAAGYKDRAAAEYEQFLAKKPDFVDREKLQKYILANKKK